MSRGNLAGLFDQTIGLWYNSVIMQHRSPEYDLSDRQREALHRVLIWTEGYFDNIPVGAHIGGHGFDKTMRQAGMAAVISSGEGYPVFLPVLTAMVMDVGRVTTDPRSRTYQHSELSREIVEASLFSTLDILTPEDRELIGNAVEDHSKKNEYVRKSYVVEVAMDADRLDCLGALGPLRSASWFHNSPIILPEETETSSVDGTLKTMYQDMAYRHMEWVEMLWTKTAREIAKPRVRAYRRYLKRLKDEASFSYLAYQGLGIE